MKIDITTSATIRPELLNITLKSFCSNLLSNDHEYRFIINVDPIGEPDKTPDDVLDVARSYFKNVIHRKPKVPCFGAAVIWCWQQTTSDLVFHLEDDWRLLKPIKLSLMLKTIAVYPKYASFRLSKKRVSKSSKNRVVSYPVLSLNPVFIRQSFIQKALKCMMPIKNPEKQLRILDPMCGRFIKKTRHGIYIEQGSGEIVKDIGRGWMKKTRLYSKKTGFLDWKPVKE